MLSRGQLDARDDGRNPAMFYSQSRGFADFMIERTGNKQIFADVARHIAAGGTMDSWLASSGSTVGLPADAASLDVQFKAWLVDRYNGQLPSERAHGHT